MLKKPQKLPENSGVYLFINQLHEIIYIGKAKNIADRVRSYFARTRDFKSQLILQEARTLNFITTQSEQEALYLEAELVKKYQPKFNILLKEGNPFIYLFFSREKIPTISIVRTKSPQKKGVYVGPFLTKKIAYSVFNFLTTTFQLKLCKKKIEHGCLDYHIGICAGFCKTTFDLSFYKFRFKLAQHLASKKPNLAIKALQAQIQLASKKMLFEKAKHLLEYKKNFEQFAQTLEKLTHMPSKTQQISHDKNLDLLIKIQKKLQLTYIPYVIDCFDISHMQSMAMVGSCIRYVHGIAQPKSFRKFHIKTLQIQDDYAALREIVQRRYKDKSNFANLVIVDGGKGQINAIKPYIGTAELVGLAKKEETIFSTNLQKLIKLDAKFPEDALLLQIRDKAHQFAISFHRKKRKLIKDESQQ